MKHHQHLFCSIAGAVAFFVIFAGLSIAQAPFTPEGQSLEPPPRDHAPGQDNGDITGGTGIEGRHFAGQDCGICHSPGKPAGNHVFSVSGTVYEDKLGMTPLAGAEVILKDSQGNVISLTSNDAGNFFSYTPVAHDPAAGEDPDTPRNWRYKAWVVQGDVVRPMMTLAYVGAMADYVPRMSCNMHHGLMGSRGTLSAGAFSTLSDFPEENISYRRHVAPVLKNRCKACHMPAAASPVTRYADTVYNYSGGLDLSDYEKDPDSAKGIVQTVDPGNPDASLLLAKPSGAEPHAGGVFWEETDPEYQAIRQWVAGGAEDN